jgi:hypothetical protein
MMRSPESAGTLLRSVVWRTLSIHGSDYCSLLQMAPGWLLKGTAVEVLKDHRPMLADCEIHCDRLWHTRRVAVECAMASATRSVHLRVGSSGEWRSPGKKLPELRECVDIDLAVTPATNTLPIRRLKLEVGQSRDGSAVWLKFPDLTLEMLSECYTRLEADRSLYQSGSGFSAEWVVDDLGLVAFYPRGWEQVASLSSPGSAETRL